jgi:hypothetical protein
MKLVIVGSVPLLLAYTCKKLAGPLQAGRNSGGCAAGVKKSGRLARHRVARLLWLCTERWDSVVGLQKSVSCLG